MQFQKGSRLLKRSNYTIEQTVSAETCIVLPETVRTDIKYYQEGKQSTVALFKFIQYAHNQVFFGYFFCLKVDF